ncbi:MAG: HNH endonuclease signature motif containing protein [Gemmatimonadaceae bacterium]|nr:HNH endonuclease signature motif containing protein [Gemmatimonadaceae bacterium]
MPTGRLAYADTRKWLVAQHGLICAYCAKRVPAKDLTLDHVAPRRGMTAYDRRDNLVLCCLACNIAKADKTTMAWLLAKRSRAVHLIRFGSHLSQLLLEIARTMLAEHETAYRLGGAVVGSRIMRYSDYEVVGGRPAARYQHCVGLRRILP